MIDTGFRGRKLSTGLALGAAWLCLLLSACGEEQVDSRLRLHYDFTSLQENVVGDRSGCGHEAALEGKEGQLPEIVNTPYGKALNLEKGRGHGLRVQFAKDLACTEGLTVMAWIRPDFVRSHLAVVANKGDTVADRPAQGYRLSVYWNRVMMDLGFGDAEGVRLSSPQWSLNAHYWSHIAMTFDGQRMSIFINATEVARKDLPEPRKLAENRRSFTIGKYFWNDAYPFTGRLADVRIFEAALTSEEIFQAARRFLDQPE